MWPGTAVLGRAASSGAVSWKLWREVSGFWPCYTGVFSGDTGVLSGDGRTVKGAWEGSAEGPRREHDFDLKYVRPGGN